MNKKINNKRYWDNRFHTDWENKLGREQSRFFAKLVIENLPAWLMSYISANSLKLCDWGCAEGDGTDVLASIFGRKNVQGVDFSSAAILKARQYYPDLKFQAENWLGEEKSNSKFYDVIFTSNVLEHFSNPYQICKTIASRAKKVIVLLVPFREFDRIDEHLYTFTSENIFVALKPDFVLVQAKIINAASLNPTYWNGEQILLTYARANWVIKSSIHINEIHINVNLSQELISKDNIIRDLNQETAEKEQIIQTHLAQIANKERMEQTLIARLDEKDQFAQELNARLDEKDQFAQELNARLVEKDQFAQELNARLVEKDRSAQELNAQLVEKDQSIQVKNAVISEMQQNLQKLNTQLSEKEKIIQILNAQIASTASSIGWMLIEALWHIRLYIAPYGSRREHILQILKGGFYLWKTKGFRKSVLDIYRYISIQQLRSWYAYAFSSFRKKRTLLSPHAYNLSDLVISSEPGLVSIVLPVYNGGNLIDESIQSILSQTYANFELIVINDGSTDGTQNKLEEYARKDQRIRVVHQENQKLPRSLSRGFHLAKGEFLTWTSCDNQLSPDFLEKLVGCLRRHPVWDMNYSNMNIIGENGQPLKYSEWYKSYQKPLGSEHIYLPDDTSELNTWPNNYIGAAFLYRNRVAWLLGDYSPFRFTTEDYDYWMRINALLNLRHADFSNIIYEYRFHANSLTSHDEELGIARGRVRLMVFDDFRRDFYLSPLVWILDAQSETPATRKVISQLQKQITQAGHQLLELDQFPSDELSRLWTPYIYVKILEDGDTRNVNKDLPRGTIKALVWSKQNSQVSSANLKWHFSVGENNVVPHHQLNNEQSKIAITTDLRTLFTALDIRVRSEHLAHIEAEVEEQPSAHYKISVIICTRDRRDKLVNCLRALADQAFPQNDYEVIVVNNDPDDKQIYQTVNEAKNTYFNSMPERLRLVQCLIPGLSHARNAGISEAHGEVLSFLDDDAIAPGDLLKTIWKAFSDHPDAGIVGGHIRLKVPRPRPRVLKPGWEQFWSEFITGYDVYTEVEHYWEFPWGANWHARRKTLLDIGGFRTRYGRRGNNFGGGEELVASSLARTLGYKVAVEPRAEVLHDVDVERYTLNHVRKTIRAATLVHYRAQKDLYIPIESRPNNTIRKAFTALKDLCVAHKIANSWPLPVFYFFAYLEVLAYQLQDSFRRSHRFGRLD